MPEGSHSGGAVRVLAMAAARDLVGAGEFELMLEGGRSVTEVIDAILVRFPGLSPYRSSLRIAINGRYATDADLVRPGDEVALLPPVAGG